MTLLLGALGALYQGGPRADDSWLLTLVGGPPVQI